MMKMSSNLDEIKATLEQIRQKYHQDVSSDIIAEIIDIQFENQETDRRVNGRAATHQAIKQYIDTQV